MNINKKWAAKTAMVTLALSMNAVGWAPMVAHAGSSETTITVHYYRYDGNYANWNLWMWPQAPQSLGGAEYDFSGTDSFGEVATASVPGDDSQVGVLVRLGNWKEKDVSENRYIKVGSGQTQVWLIEGDPNIYYSAQAAQAAAHPHLQSAFLDDSKTITAKLSGPVALNGQSTFTLTDETTGQTISVTSVKDANTVEATVASNFQQQVGASGNWDASSATTRMRQINPDLYQYTCTLKAGSYQYKVALNGGWSEAYPSSNVTLNVPTDGTKVTISYIPSTHQVFDSINNPDASLTGSGGEMTDLITLTLANAPNVTHTLSLSANGLKDVTVTPRNVLSEAQYTYQGDDLGNTYTPQGTHFRVWAPTASAMNLQLFDSATGALTKQVPMQRSENGTWVADVPGNLKGWYYLYQVTIDGKTDTAVDPYVRAIGPDSNRGEIVDLESTNPPGWPSDRHVGVKNPVDAVIYELSTRDFSVDPNSGVKPAYRGKYLAFTEHGTRGPNHVKTGIDSLKQLGVTDVQVMPVEDFPDANGSYNWGYVTRNFNVPEGNYATTPYGTTPITEYKRMVQSLHKDKIGVIMDVVYNHAFSIEASSFNKLVPGYFFRTDEAGNYTNGSGVGNEIASERPMVQKFIIDSLKYWVTEYHIDGFRFDLMALLGVDTMKKVSQALHQIDPQIILYGEPWTGGTTPLPASQQLTKGKQRGLGIGVFNDNLRNGIEGNVFDAKAKGFAMGGGDSYVHAIKDGVVGSIAYNSQIHDFASAPSESINYVTSHDNYTLWDKLQLSNPNASVDTRIRMDELAQAIVFTSQGVPFMQGGEEMLRTKQLNGNSYNAGDAVNEFDWSRKAKYQNVFNYYAGLIQLRKAHPAFRMTTADEIKQHLQFLNSPDNTVEYELTNHAGGDKWRNILVIYNPNHAQSFNLPGGQWNVVGTQGQIGEKTLNKVTGQVEVPAYTAEILYQKK